MLEAAVREVDFTPAGVTVWLRGTVDAGAAPAVADDETAIWLEIESSGQRLLIVAGDDPGRAALAELRRSPPGAVTLFGEVTGNAQDGGVTVRIAGISREG